MMNYPNPRTVTLRRVEAAVTPRPQDRQAQQCPHNAAGQHVRAAGPP